MAGQCIPHYFVHIPLRSDGNPPVYQGFRTCLQVHTPLRSDGNSTHSAVLCLIHQSSHSTQVRWEQADRKKLEQEQEQFTLHSGQMGTVVVYLVRKTNKGFTLHSGQMGTDGVKLLILTRFYLFRKGRFSGFFQQGSI